QPPRVPALGATRPALVGARPHRPARAGDGEGRPGVERRRDQPRDTREEGGRLTMTTATATGASSLATPNPIWEAFATARDDRPQLHCWDGSTYSSHRWDDWRSGAERAGAGLRQLCVREGS